MFARLHGRTGRKTFILISNNSEFQCHVACECNGCLVMSHVQSTTPIPVTRKTQPGMMPTAPWEIKLDQADIHFEAEISIFVGALGLHLQFERDLRISKH